MGLFILVLVILGFGIGVGFILGFSRAMHRVAIRLQGPNESRFNAKLMIGFGATILVIGLGHSIHTWHFVSIAKRTKGTVIGLLEKSGEDSVNHSVAPKFRYQDSSGTFHTNSSRLYSYPPRFRIGDTVTVLFRVSEPERARIESFFDLWAVPIFIGGFGSVLAAIGWVLFLRKK